VVVGAVLLVPQVLEDVLTDDSNAKYWRAYSCICAFGRVPAAHAL
jgi:hypothetical protein